MWQGRHHSAQKSTSTGCVLLAVSTSASKLPSVTAEILLSAMFFVLNGLPPEAAVCLSPIDLIRCCNRLLDTGRLPWPSSRLCLRIQLAVLRGGSSPRKILGHAVQLDALPNALVGEVLQCLTHTPQQRLARIFGELE